MRHVAYVTCPVHMMRGHEVQGCSCIQMDELPLQYTLGLRHQVALAKAWDLLSDDADETAPVELRLQARLPAAQIG